MADIQGNKLPVHDILTQSAPLLLLTLAVYTVFLIPVMPHSAHGLMYNVAFSAIYFTSVLALQKKRRIMLTAAILVFFMEWLAMLVGAPVLLLISRLANLLFFNIVVIRLITQIAGYRDVNLTVISEAISGYLLLGLMFSTLVMIVVRAQPESYSFQSENISSISDLIYFTFVTLTTLGYGDLLPLLPVAKSLSLLIAVVGQLYIAIIVAMLVGKFLSQSNH